MKERKAGNHKWSKTSDGEWECARCGAVARSHGGSPSSAVGGRTYNGTPLGASGRLPRCGDEGASSVRKNTSERVIRVDITYLRKTLDRALGLGYVNRALNLPTGKLDPGQDLEVQRVYAAFRVNELDALGYIDMVRSRLKELRRQQLDTTAEATLNGQIVVSQAALRGSRKHLRENGE